jgi:hypothetical protein
VSLKAGLDIQARGKILCLCRDRIPVSFQKNANITWSFYVKSNNAVNHVVTNFFMIFILKVHEIKVFPEFKFVIMAKSLSIILINEIRQ